MDQKPGAAGGGADWVTIIVTLTGLAWAGWYVWSTATNPFDEPEAAWLIQPLLIVLCVTAPFVLLSARPPLPERLRPDDAESLAIPARWGLVLSLPVLAGLIWVFGFLISALLYLPLMTRLLGERRPGVIAAITLGALALILAGFNWGLGVNLPLWPRFAG